MFLTSLIIYPESLHRPSLAPWELLYADDLVVCGSRKQQRTD